MKKENPELLSDFEKEVRSGLTAYPKILSSRFFYDKKGDKLFQEIMELPEYYLTRCESEIIEKHSPVISEIFNGPSGFDLFELGAGDGKKTKVLLRYFLEKQLNFSYFPLDISPNVLDQLEKSLKTDLPTLKVNPLQETYTGGLKLISRYTSRKKIIMMLGSNIGNLQHPEAINFLKNIQGAMSNNDILFMGFDQKKDPKIILEAYNDSAGITEAFNKNILERINTEMDANFNIDSFTHWPIYDPETGTVKSFLVSRIAQDVKINSLDLVVHFNKWESIHTEISQKYDDNVVEWLAGKAGLKVHSQLTDSKHYYKNYFFKKLSPKNKD